MTLVNRTQPSSSAAGRVLGFGKDGAMKPRAANHLRIARPSHDLQASERFWAWDSRCCCGLMGQQKVAMGC